MCQGLGTQRQFRDDHPVRKALGLAEEESRGNGIIAGGLCEQKLHSEGKGDAVVLPMWGGSSSRKGFMEEVTLP